MRRFVAVTVVVLGLVLSGLLQVSTARAAGPGDLIVSTTYPAVMVDKGKPVTFPIDVENKSQTGQEVELSVGSVPEGWSSILKSGDFVVRKVWVPAGKSQSLDLQLKLPDTVKTQDYNLQLIARTPDGSFQQNLGLTVGVQDKAIGGLALNTQFPQLSGPAGNKLEFKLDLNNDATEERTINLAYKAPEGWQISFQPAYDQKSVTSVRLKGGTSQGIDVEVTPPDRAEAGEYTIDITASAGNDRAQQSLKAIILGNYKLDLSTQDGLLNTRATAGSQTTTTLQIKNVGSAALQNVTFTASKPDGWEVTFAPDKIESLPPGQTSQVNMTIKPSGKALAGDYMVSTTASTSQTSASRDLRVTVETPTAWGFIGVGIVVLVVVGLGAMFTKLSRR